jgi:hypothetical protein
MQENFQRKQQLLNVQELKIVEGGWRAESKLSTEKLIH